MSCRLTEISGRWASAARGRKYLPTPSELRLLAELGRGSSTGLPCVSVQGEDGAGLAGLRTSSGRPVGTERRHTRSPEAVTGTEDTAAVTLPCQTIPPGHWSCLTWGRGRDGEGRVPGWGRASATQLVQGRSVTEERNVITGIFLRGKLLCMFPPTPGRNLIK